MAFGKGGAGFGPNVKVYSFNLKDKDLPAPQFDVLTKQEGQEKSEKVDTATRVSGNLIGVRNKQFTHKGDVIKSVTATLRDGNEVYFVSIPYTYLGRNIMNSLCGLKTFNDIELSVYKSKPKEQGQTGFSSSALRQKGELVYGKHEYKSLPEIPKKLFKGKMHGDDTEINAFFEKEIAELATRVQANHPEEVTTPATGEVDSTPETQDGDVPF